MTEKEYEDWRAEGDQRVGRCPICDRPGWIVGDTEWCEHYAATYDTFAGSAPISPLTEGEPFLTYERFLVALREQGEKEVQRLLASLPPREWDFVKRSLDHWPEVFWLAFTATKRLSADLVECLFETTYVSVFVEDPVAERHRLGELVDGVLEVLRCSSEARALLGSAET